MTHHILIEQGSVDVHLGRPVRRRIDIVLRRCIVHDQTYTAVCPGCRADEIAAEESA